MIRFVPIIPWCALALVFIPGNCWSLGQSPEDQGKGLALSPDESMQKFVVPSHLKWTRLLSEPEITQPLMTTHDRFGRLWVVEYRQYPEPAGLKPLSQDKHLRRVYDAIPLPPGKGGVPGVDRISVHQDKNGDGVLDHHTLFVDGLNIATAVVPVRDGAWVLNPPYLIFYPDADGDLQADGPPQIHLQGFGLEDTHSVVNSLCMGPDGWLYAAQGSTVSGSVKHYGSSEPPWQSMGQAIWRFHPVTHQYEIFAEGGGNAFGVAMNDSGELFSGHNGGDTRGFHYYQGGYYRKGFSKHGSLSNPHTFGYLMPMRHDPVQRFTHTMMMTDSTSLGPLMPNGMIAVDPLHCKLIQTELIPDGSTYATRDVLDAVASDDRWFRPVAIHEGPAGEAIVCDWYDFGVAHIYAFEGRMDREHGRVYSLSASHDEHLNDPDWKWNAPLANRQDRAALEYLYDRLSHPIRWQRWQARWLIAEHPLRDSYRDRLLNRLLPAFRPPTDGTPTPEWLPLEYLWTAHACGWIAHTLPATHDAPLDPALLLSHPNAQVRQWTIRLACDRSAVPDSLATAIATLATTENHPKVLCQIACSARRLSAPHMMEIMASLLSRPLPNNDPFLGLLIWWGIERHAESNEIILEPFVRQTDLWENTIVRDVVAPNLIGRWCRGTSSQSMSAAARLIGRIAQLPDDLRHSAADNVQAAFEQSFVGRSLAGVPNELIDALGALGQPSLTLRLRRGDGDVLEEAASVILDQSKPEGLRMQLARIAGERKGTERLLPTLRSVALSESELISVRTAAIAALAAFDQPGIGTELIGAWPSLAIDLRSVVGGVLASRPAWTDQWLTACENKQVVAHELPLEAIRGMRMHLDESLQHRINAMYPESASINLVAAQERSTRAAEVVLREPGDPYRGKKQYRALCSRCHRLFDEGGNVGPDLTGYQRDQLPTLLRNIIAPSLEIREGYQTVRLLTIDSLVLSGFIESQNADLVVLRGIDGESRSLARSDIERLEPQLLSIMPEGLLDPLTDQQLSDLMAYLRSSQPLNDG